MSKHEIISRLNENYNQFIDFINSLSQEEYSFGYQQKWTAGQQLEHIVLCVKPIVQVFSMDKALINQAFGSSDRLGSTYDILLDQYLEKLSEGGKAPDRYVPKESLFDNKESLTSTLKKLINELSHKIETFTDQELGSLQIPHPLLGNLTLREMLYNVIYHVKHHHELAKYNLVNS